MIKGSLVAVVSPMQEDGSLDLDALRRLVEWHIGEGTNAIVETTALVIQASPSWRTYQQNNGVSMQATTKAPVAMIGTGTPAMAALSPPVFMACSRIALISIEKAMISAGTYLIMRSK